MITLPSDITLTFVDVLTPLAEGYFITRTWTATDACGNAADCDQVITVNSCELTITDPCLCVDDATIIDLDAGTGGDDGHFTETVAISNGGNPIPLIPGIEFVVTILNGGYEMNPNPAPEVPIALPTNLVWVETAPGSGVGFYQLSFFHTDGLGYDITIEQRVIATGQLLQVFSISNNCEYPNPVFDPVIEDLYCPDDLAFNLGGIDLGGLGSDVVSFEIDNIVVTQLDPPNLSVGLHTLVMTWDGAAGTNDGSGTAANPNEPGCIQTVQKVFEVNDTEPPVISCPGNLTIDCTADTSPANTGTATATDNCNTAPVITFVDAIAPGTCPQEMTITRTWTATDGIGLTAVCTQTIIVDDSTPPVIVCPPNQVLTCFETTPAPFTTAADFIAAGGVISDDCTTNLDEFTVFTQNADNGGDNCPGNANIVTRTYYIQDACGNTSTCEQVFTYLESVQAPVITSVLPTCYKYCGSLANPMEIGYYLRCRL